jgi:iron complex outermembrane recepter protein
MNQRKIRGGRRAASRISGIFALGVMAFAAGVAAAQEDSIKAEPATAAEEAGTIRAAPVVVTPTRTEQSAFDLPTAVSTVEGETIQEANIGTNVSEALVRVPGTVVQNRETYAQEQQIIVRGFGARSSFGTRGIKLLADGIPASTPDGQGGPGLFDLDSAKRIEVLRGPFSALYGNHSGGVVQIFTEDGPEQPTLTGNFTAGSYNTWKAGVKFGGQASNLNYIGSYSQFETDGYREHSAAQKEQFNGKLHATFENGASLTWVANYLDQPGNEDPLGLTKAQVEEDRRQAGDNAVAFNTGRDLSNVQTGLVYEMPLSDRDTLRLMGYLGQRDNYSRLAVLNVAGTAPNNSATTSGGISVLNRDFYGVGARWAHKADLLGGPLTFMVGADYDYAIDGRKGYVNNYGVQTFLKRDEDNIADSNGGYLQAEWQVAQQWTASAGVRYTQVNFESKDYYPECRGSGGAVPPPYNTLPICPGNATGNGYNLNDSGSASYDAVTPVAGVVFKATPTLNLYANVGKSFETPTLIELAYRPDGQPGLNFDLKPSESWHYEVGAKTFLGTSTIAELAIFQIDTQDEIVIAENNLGRQTYQNAGSTQRRGIELSVSSEIGHGFGGTLAATYLEAKFSESYCSGVSLSTACPAAQVVGVGNRIPAVPRYTVFGELVWRYAPAGFMAGIEGRWQGDVAANDLNTAFAESYFVTAVKVGLEQRSRGWRLNEFARVNNAFNEQYIGAVIVNATANRFYSPAAERNYLVGMSASYAF